MTKFDIDKQKRKEIEASEIAYHANIWENAAYNPTGNKLRLNREFNVLKQLSSLKKFKRVLSIGCGDGEFELILAPGAEHITAIDISPEAINSAELKMKEKGVYNIDFQCCSFSDISWDKKFDTIICLSFLHHVPEAGLLSFLQQVYDHLECRGFFYSQDPNINGILRKIGRIILGKTYDKYHTPDEQELDPASMVSLFRKAGFSSVKINYTDLTLIPLLYMFTRRFEWLMYLSLWVDLLWAKGPFAPYASGFSAICRKS